MHPLTRTAAIGRGRAPRASCKSSSIPVAACAPPSTRRDPQNSSSVRHGILEIVERGARLQKSAARSTPHPEREFNVAGRTSGDGSCAAVTLASSKRRSSLA